MAKQALYVLVSGSVIDRSALIALPSTGVEQVIVQTRMAPLPLVVVDTAESFFNGPNLIALLKAGDPKCKLIAERFEMKFNNDTVALIMRATEAEAQLLKAATPPVPPYPFAVVPEGWTTAKLSIGPTQIKRKAENAQGDGTGYSLTPEQVQKVWKTASTRWAAGKTSVNADKLVKDHNTRYISVYNDRVAVGCQTIRRYELEQLAKHKDWQFPVAEAK